MSAVATTRNPVRSLRRPAPATLFALLLIALLALVCLRTGGGVDLGRMTILEVALVLLGGAAGAIAIAATDGRRAWGGMTVALLGLLAVVTALSIGWSVDPSEAWLEASRTFAWLAAFVIGVVIGRLAGAWWEQLLVAMLTVAVVVSVYALACKVFPAALNPEDTFARLRQPYGYWNAVGLTAALGLPGCLWLGSRRHGHAPFDALAFPACALLVTTMLLAVSRGTVLAAIIGAIVWLAVVPLRLRTIAVLAVGSAGGILVSLYAFGRDSLAADKIDLSLRTSAGHELGLAVLVMLLAELIIGLAITFALTRRTPQPGLRRRVATAVVIVTALVPIVVAGKLATSDRGLTGSVSHVFNQLVDTKSTNPSNDPSRLSAAGSVRARYWNEAFKIMADHPWKGVGAGGYSVARPRYRDDQFTVRHAHGYAAQTASDLGIIGLVISLALLVSWLVTAARTTGLGLRRLDTGHERFTPERIGLVALATTVVVFGVHSLIDWTWFVPGNAIPALLCAGFVAGRGPLREAARTPSEGLLARARQGLGDPLRAGAAAAVLVFAVGCAWSTLQPWRSVQASDAALAALERPGSRSGNLASARGLAQTAVERNPLSIEPLFVLSAIEKAADRPRAAEKALEEAVQLQPSNAQTWIRYAEFELFDRDRPRRALRLLDPALFLDPYNGEAWSFYVEGASRIGKIARPPVVLGSEPQGKRRRVG